MLRQVLVEILQWKVPLKEIVWEVEEQVGGLLPFHSALNTAEDAEPPQKLATTQSPQCHLYLGRVEAVAEGH